MDLAAAAAALQRTHVPEMGPAQLEVSNVAVALDAKQIDSRQVIYVDVRCGTDLFRTTAQARKFDPLAPKDQPLAFDTDRGTMAVPLPLGPSDMLHLSVRRCQIFGDSDLCGVSVPVAALPLVKETRCHFKAGRFIFTILPVNIGHPPAAPGEGRGAPNAPCELSEGVLELTFDDVRLTAASRGGARKHGRPARPVKERPPVISAGAAVVAACRPATQQQSAAVSAAPAPVAPPAAAAEKVQAAPAPVDSPRDASSAGQAPPSPTARPGEGAERAAPRDPSPEAPVASSSRSPPMEAGAEVASPRAAAPAAPTAAAEPEAEAGDFEDDEDEEEHAAMPRGFPGLDDPTIATGPLEIFKNDDALKPLWYRGAVPTAASEIPVGYKRSIRLKGLLAPAGGAGGSASGGGGGIMSLFGAVTSAVAHAVTDVSTAVELEMMRGHFPHIRAPLVRAYSPHVLNGHGTPIEGSLFITTKGVAFHGPLLQFEVTFADLLHVRRALSFGRDCIQLFCPGHAVYQLQGIDGIVARFGSAIGVREHSKFYDAYCLLVDLWRTARGLPAPPSAAA